MKIRKNERGFSLIIGMSILILLTVLGIAVIQTVNADIDSATADKGQQIRSSGCRSRHRLDYRLSADAVRPPSRDTSNRPQHQRQPKG